MSIVIIAFDKAPKVTDEAKRKEAELDARLEVKVKGSYFVQLLCWLTTEDVNR